MWRYTILPPSFNTFSFHPVAHIIHKNGAQIKIQSVQMYRLKYSKYITVKTEMNYMKCTNILIYKFNTSPFLTQEQICWPISSDIFVSNDNNLVSHPASNGAESTNKSTNRRTIPNQSPRCLVRISYQNITFTPIYYTQDSLRHLYHHGFILLSGNTRMMIWYFY